MACHGLIPSDFARNIASLAKLRGHEPPKDIWDAGRGPMDPDPAVTLWGTGHPLREFLYSDDLASACVFLMQRLDAIFARSKVPSAGAGVSAAGRNLFNIGCGTDGTIKEPLEMVARIVGFHGPVRWDSSKPD